MEKIKILIADDHALILEGLRKILEEQKEMEVVGEATNGMDAVKKAKSLRPNVVILDVAMPELNGLEAVGLIRESVPETQVVIFSIHNKDGYVFQALNSGALGYVLKSSPISELPEAIRAANRGKYFLGSEINPEALAHVKIWNKARLRKGESNGGENKSVNRG